jgi:hypothetical protein
MVSTSREWLHGVDSDPSGLMSQWRGSADGGHSGGREQAAGFDPKLIYEGRAALIAP